MSLGEFWFTSHYTKRQHTAPLHTFSTPLTTSKATPTKALSMTCFPAIPPFFFPFLFLSYLFITTVLGPLREESRTSYYCLTTSQFHVLFVMAPNPLMLVVSRTSPPDFTCGVFGIFDHMDGCRWQSGRCVFYSISRLIPVTFFFSLLFSVYVQCHGFKHTRL